ncbi:hypothetical protein SETIT_7G021700v2 [Setaria italica]|uniref:Uncharacterized protein n=1 Tax=Setaria italica TaxID=4555 RepID=A0A368RRA2_SETIT|nr:hypothetical protein SETIT_7G021700v2 [Setaria italica]
MDYKEKELEREEQTPHKHHPPPSQDQKMERRFDLHEAMRSGAPWRQEPPKLIGSQVPRPIGLGLSYPHSSLSSVQLILRRPPPHLTPPLPCSCTAAWVSHGAPTSAPPRTSLTPPLAPPPHRARPRAARYPPLALPVPEHLEDRRRGPLLVPTVFRLHQALSDALTAANRP